MADINWTEQETDRLKELINEGYTNKEIASMLSSEYGREFSKISVKSKRQRLKEAKPPRVNSSQTEIKSDGTQTHQIKVRMTEEQSKDPDYVLQAHGYSPDSWELIQATNNIWEQNNREDGLIQLYQSKIVVKPRVAVSIETIAAKLLQSTKPIKIQPIIKGERNLVIPLADLHFPILTEIKFESYLSDVLAMINKGYKTIVFEVLGDIFHSNAMKSSQTIRGTQLEDVDMVEAIELAKTFFITLIDESLRKSSEVRIEFASGNHSDFEYLFLMYLETLYPQVTVNKHNLPRIAYQLDNVGIMLTHGHFGKKGDYPMLFATEFRDVWSKSSWLEIHQGHYHSMEAQNLKGVIHRQLGTIKPNDQYESENGYTMNYKSTQAFEYSADKLKVIYELG
ncbi:helix-turn-helix domain-containing protein [Enterococcus casseliflavus]|uniref:helix-turn-helix domain-containing protein n=1 Tax=Enterococcus casseliflavus TaxID=37734 RepID=UPI003D0F1BB0